LIYKHIKNKKFQQQK